MVWSWTCPQEDIWLKAKEEAILCWSQGRVSSATDLLLLLLFLRNDLQKLGYNFNKDLSDVLSSEVTWVGVFLC